jgi:hypothetical protein
MQLFDRATTTSAALVVLALGLPAATRAAGPPDTAAMLAAQREALQPLAAFDGVWRGPATVMRPDGSAVQIVQTERVGPLLDGTVRLIEGRGHMPDGSIAFNAFAVISFALPAMQYNFRSYAQGYAGDFPIDVRPDGFTWRIPAGPGTTLRYTATVKDGVWSEIGERLVEGQAPVKTFEMALKRVGDTAWPGVGAVGVK